MKKPPITCPIIDKCISEINDAIYYLKFVMDRDVILYSLDSALAILEEIRTANENLRAWGQNNYDEYCSSEERVKELERELNEIESEAAGE